MADDSFEGIWNDPSFQFHPNLAANPSAGSCVYAVQFQAWVDATFECVLEQDLVSVNHCKLFLLDRFFQFRASVPRRHHNVTSGRQAHTCIFDVFETAYNRLRVRELSLAPPPIVVKVRSTPQPNRLDALIIGTLEPDPEFGPYGS